MKLERIVNLLNSDNEGDNIIGYKLLKRKYKIMWLANAFLGKYDIYVDSKRMYGHIAVCSDPGYDELGPYWGREKIIFIP